MTSPLDDRTSGASDDADKDATRYQPTPPIEPDATRYGDAPPREPDGTRYGPAEVEQTRYPAHDPDATGHGPPTPAAAQRLRHSLPVIPGHEILRRIGKGGMG